MNEGPPSITPALGVGLHDISDELYHADPAEAPSLSASLSKTLIGKSCRHAYYEHPRLGGQLVPRKAPTPDMEFGTLIHALLLAGGKGLAIGKFPTWQSNEAKAFRIAARNSKMLPVLEKTLDEAKEICAAFHEELARLNLDKLFAAARKEVTGIWKDKGNGLWMRSKYDGLVIDEVAEHATIFDIKVSEKANPASVGGQMGAMNYDMGERFYREGITTIFPQLAGRVNYLFLFIDPEFPFDLVPVEPDGEMQVVGDMKFARAKKLWSLCRSTGEWPGYVSGTFRASPKPWDITREAEAVLPEFGANA
jgi:hypothetical protein